MPNMSKPPESLLLLLRALPRRGGSPARGRHGCGPLPGGPR